MSEYVANPNRELQTLKELNGNFKLKNIVSDLKGKTHWMRSVAD